MLFLKRHKAESILIGEDVEIVITDVHGDDVQIGIIAPKSIPVHRKEVYESIHHKEASSVSSPNQTAISTYESGHNDESMLILSDYYIG